MGHLSWSRVRQPTIGASIIASSILDLQNGERLAEHVDAFGANAPKMGLEEIAAEEMKLINELTMVGFNLNVSVSLAQSGKNAVQTLFKNQ